MYVCACVRVCDIYIFSFKKNNSEAPGWLSRQSMKLDLGVVS